MEAEPDIRSEETTELDMAPRGHAHEAEVSTEGLGRIARMRLKAQLKVLEAAPVLAPFLETQAACACKAGCPTCAGPTLGASAWTATKVWFGGRFSRSPGEKQSAKLPSMSEGPVHFVMRSAEATMSLPAEKPVDIADTVVRHHLKAAEQARQ